MAAGGRHGARRLLLQALYQSQVGGHDPEELAAQFRRDSAFAGVDQAYFLTMLGDVLSRTAELDEHIRRCADRPVEQLDPVERSVLWIGLMELTGRDDIPPKVAISEAVSLAREFGAQDSHRYINAILDSAARSAS